MAFATFFLWIATRQLVEDAKRNAERQLRAYVFLDPGKEFNFVRRPSTTSAAAIEINVKNLGLTPAHDVLTNSWMTADAWPLPQKFNFTGQQEEKPSRAVIPPSSGSSVYRTGTARPLTAGEWTEIISGRQRIYIYGRIEYRDAFDHPHWTNFCYASTVNNEGFTAALAKCDRHNDADSD